MLNFALVELVAAENGTGRKGKFEMLVAGGGTQEFRQLLRFNRAFRMDNRTKSCSMIFIHDSILDDLRTIRCFAIRHRMNLVRSIVVLVMPEGLVPVEVLVLVGRGRLCGAQQDSCGFVVTSRRA